jgi:hypothetical protein
VDGLVQQLFDAACSIIVPNTALIKQNSTTSKFQRIESFLPFNGYFPWKPRNQFGGVGLNVGKAWRSLPIVPDLVQ